MMRKISVLFQQHAHFAKFLVVGSINTVFDLIVFFILADIFNLNVIIANIVSTGLTMCLSFYLNHHFVFESKKQKRSVAIQFGMATIFNIWVIQSGIIALVLHAFRNSHYFITHNWTLNIFSKLCGIGISFILNYVMYHYIFRQEEEEPPIL